MNAIISICHFCELHGPSIIFCTQTFRDQHGFHALPFQNTFESIRSSNKQNGVNNCEEKPWKYGPVPSDQQSADGTSKNATCVACRSFPHNKPGIISNDDGARVSYVSSQYPQQVELLLLLRQACTRSLSCEQVCPGCEEPIYFGDEARGHVLSHTFSLKDVQARGFQRWYSILILMKDKMFLLNSWPFLVHHIREVINQLQKSAAKVYQDEESKVSHRSLRSAASMATDNFRRQRCHNKAVGQPRCLPELVGNDQVWQKLHSSLTWLLKAGGMRLQEKFVEGLPMEAYAGEPGEICTGSQVRDIYKALGGLTFQRLLHHLLTGDQVIIKGHDSTIVSYFILCLKPLVPRYCFNAISFSEKFIFSESNIMGIHSSVVIPSFILEKGHFCAIDILPLDTRENKSWTSSSLIKGIEVSRCDQSSSNSTTRQQPPSDKEGNKNVLQEQDNKFKFYAQISQESQLSARPPQAVSRIESAITNDSLSDSTLLIYITTVVDEWANKVKVWAHIYNKLSVNASGGVYEISSKCSQPPNAKLSSPMTSHPNITRAPLSHFSTVSNYNDLHYSETSATDQHQRSVTSPSDQRQQLLIALRATEFDVPLLNFWAKHVVSC